MLKKRKKLFVFNAVILQIFLLVGMSIAIAVMMGKSVNGQSLSQVAGQNSQNVQILTTTANPTGVLGSKALYASSSKIMVGGEEVTLQSIKVVSPNRYDVIGKYADGEIYRSTLTSERLTGMGSTISSASPYATQYGYEGVDIPLIGKSFQNSPVLGSLTGGIVYAGLVVGLVQLVGSLTGMNESLTNSLSLSLGGGIIVGSLVKGIIMKGGVEGGLSSTFANIFKFGKGTMTPGTSGFLWGAAAAVAIFILTYKNEKTKTVTFQCLPWQPVTGGAKCEECNKDPYRPCSEYRCKSLGQACILINAGTKNETCAWVSRNDVASPIITPDKSAFYPISLSLKYTDDRSRPPSRGTIISAEGRAGGCLPAFTPLKFGFSTNEPAQCKISLNYSFATAGVKERYDSLEYFVGGDNLYLYNHTQTMKLPGGNEMAPLLQSDGTFMLYVMCQDANGNVGVGNINEDVYTFKFCVDKSPDTTQPVIEGFSIPSESFVAYNQDSAQVELYINEPAECKWSTQSKDIKDMENKMACAESASQFNLDLTYTCTANLTGIKNREENKYYFRCNDHPEWKGTSKEGDRNPNTQSIEYILKGSRPLDIIKVEPNETVSGSTEAVSVDLKVETSNGAQENGNATCLVSENRTENFELMSETNSYSHKQTLSLGNGDYTYYFRCIDAGGNMAKSNTTFRVSVDKFSPVAARVYKDEEKGLKVVTDEDAQCVYSISSCNYKFEDGQKMSYAKPDERQASFVDWNVNNIYYVKCMDDYKNQPDESKCSIVIKASDLLKTKT